MTDLGDARKQLGKPLTEYTTAHATNPAPADAPRILTIDWRAGNTSVHGFSTEQAAERWLDNLRHHTRGIVRSQIKENKS
jgi:hypothetical protein